MRWAIIQILPMLIEKGCDWSIVAHRCPSMGLNGVSVRDRVKREIKQFSHTLLLQAILNRWLMDLKSLQITPKRKFSLLQ